MVSLSARVQPLSPSNGQPSKWISRKRAHSLPSICGVFRENQQDVDVVSFMMHCGSGTVFDFSWCVMFCHSDCNAFIPPLKIVCRSSSFCCLAVTVIIYCVVYTETWTVLPSLAVETPGTRSRHRAMRRQMVPQMMARCEKCRDSQGRGRWRAHDSHASTRRGEGKRHGGAKCSVESAAARHISNLGAPRLSWHGLYSRSRGSYKERLKSAQTQHHDDTQRTSSFFFREGAFVCPVARENKHTDTSTG